jgi:DNA-binding transcriptional LysR family regulator
MNFYSLPFEHFLAVVEAGTFQDAAEKLGKTKACVSHHIAILEKKLSKTLFFRNSHTLTPEGEIFLLYAKKIAQLNREVVERFTQQDLHGEVRFGLQGDFAHTFLSKIITEYASLHPRSSLKIECDLTLNLFERFKKKEFDLVLVTMSKPEDFPKGKDICSEKLEWVGNKDLFDQSFDQPLPLVLISPTLLISCGSYSFFRKNK